ncbi:MAG: glycosyltransferase family 4 protein [Patescibacteria group bacterium]|nr:glycosyltransferase family 4 protein [Patescibacteria group bacterium]
MKIAIVSDAVYPYHKGGKERRFSEISTRLAARGHEVTIYCMKWWKEPGLTRIENRVRLHAISPLYPMYSGKRRSIRQGLLFGIHCLKLLREDWDVIEVDHMPYFPLYFTRIVCWLKGKKMFATWNEVWGKKYWVRYMGGLSGIVGYMIERFSILLPDAFMAISYHTSERLQQVYNVPRSRVCEVLTGLDTISVRDIDPSAQSCDILYAGRLLKHKNVHLLVQAVARLVPEHRDLRCLIVGNGPEKKGLIQLVEQLGLQRNIIFLNFLPHHHEVFKLMKSAKTFCLPSTREGFGMAVLEANACGVPAIVIRNPENASVDLIEGVNGVVVEPSAEGIARGFSQLVSRKCDPDAVMRIAAKYDWEQIINRLLQAYEAHRPHGGIGTMNIDVSKA